MIAAVELGWQRAALCAGHPDGDLWNSGDHAYARARKICNRCPVREQCFEHALTNSGCVGMWGGRSERERRRMRLARQS